MVQLKIEVIKILEAGKCNYGHKVGDKFSYPEEKGKLCSAAWNTMFPYLSGMQFGASYPWEEDINSITLCCPDYKNPVVFKISREE